MNYFGILRNGPTWRLEQRYWLQSLVIPDAVKYHFIIGTMTIIKLAWQIDVLVLLNWPFTGAPYDAVQRLVRIVVEVIEEAFEFAHGYLLHIFFKHQAVLHGHIAHYVVNPCVLMRLHFWIGVANYRVSNRNAVMTQAL